MALRSSIGFVLGVGGKGNPLQDTAVPLSHSGGTLGKNVFLKREKNATWAEKERKKKQQCKHLRFFSVRGVGGG